MTSELVIHRDERFVRVKLVMLKVSRTKTQQDFMCLTHDRPERKKKLFSLYQWCPNPVLQSWISEVGPQVKGLSNCGIENPAKIQSLITGFGQPRLPPRFFSQNVKLRLKNSVNFHIPETSYKLAIRKHRCFLQQENK